MMTETRVDIVAYGAPMVEFAIEEGVDGVDLFHHRDHGCVVQNVEHLRGHAVQRGQQLEQPA